MLNTIHVLVACARTHVCVDYGQFTNHSGYFCAKDDMPLLAERYKYVSTVGQGQSAVVVSAEVLFVIVIYLIFIVLSV